MKALDITKEPKTTFENWKINLELFCLQDDKGNELFMQPRLIKLLTVLLDNANHVVSKSDLTNVVWDDVIVGEESLSKAAFDLRRFLEDNFSNPPNIATIRKVGYKLELNPSNQKITSQSKGLKILKTVVYIVIILVVTILVLRGLQYEN